MESRDLGLIRGFVVDSSVLVKAERGKLTTPEVIRNLRQAAGDVPIVISALTVAELGHGIYHAREEGKSRQRRRFLDELKQYVPIHPITGATAEIVARIGGEQAVNGITVPFADLIIGACALELGYAVATHNVRHFRLIPGLDVRQF
ncbi:MAG TPA: PIN domain-containing protein [Bryobacteraceae bacterium]|nr:PIN domain-containing protein [Bryobacteraceae bacterium]